MDDMLREHNERFFYLTAQNFRTCNDVWVSCIMFRLGQHERWTYIGMPTVICDGMAKIRASASSFNVANSDMREGIVITTKKPSAGLDLIREYLDTRRCSYQFYIMGWVQAEDGQKLIQLKRTTEGGLQTGYVLVVGNRIERMPETELAADCMLPEVSHMHWSSPTELVKTSKYLSSSGCALPLNFPKCFVSSWLLSRQSIVSFSESQYASPHSKFSKCFGKGPRQIVFRPKPEMCLNVI